MEQRGWSGALVSLIVVLGATLAGCATEVGQEPSSSDPGATASADESTAPAGAKPEAKTADDRRQCSPLTCCFPNVVAAWGDDAFESELQKLGCTSPQAYEITDNQTRLWVSTQCPLRIELLAAVARYSGTPYDARFVFNPCLGFVPGTIDVVYDPTCSTCRITLPGLGGGVVDTLTGSLTSGSLANGGTVGD